MLMKLVGGSIKVFNLFYIFWSFLSFTVAAQEITPYKFTDEEMEKGGPKYVIPPESRFTTKRATLDSPDIVYYFSPPHNNDFPITIFCAGSSSENYIVSSIHFHRYYLKEFRDLGIGVITVEQQGVDGNQIDVRTFMDNYTRSNRLSDHRTVIEHLKKSPPAGWNGKLVFMGGSEGGLLVTTLTTDYPDMTVATVNWSGSAGLPWDDELWYFTQNIMQSVPWHVKLRAQLPWWMPYSINIDCATSRTDHDKAMNETIKNPTSMLKFLGMTYKYHADALTTYPKPAFDKIKTPFLMVAGALDSSIDSSDAFINQAVQANSPVTYMRITNMDHYVRKRLDVVEDSFIWLKNQLSHQNVIVK